MAKTKVGHDYHRIAGQYARAAGVTKLDGPVAVTLDVFRPRKAGDLDNTLKVLLDSLTGIAYADDSQIVEINSRRYDDPKNPRVEVRVSRCAWAIEQPRQPLLMGAGA